MFYFPLVNLLFLILIYRVHKPIFWIIGIIEVAVYVGGILYIEEHYQRVTNQFLYYLALAGLGLIIGVAGFFIAISLNHRRLYADQPKMN
jgi:hypothetical protein